MIMKNGRNKKLKKTILSKFNKFRHNRVAYKTLITRITESQFRVSKANIQLETSITLSQPKISCFINQINKHITTKTQITSQHQISI